MAGRRLERREGSPLARPGCPHRISTDLRRFPAAGWLVDGRAAFAHNKTSLGVTLPNGAPMPIELSDTAVTAHPVDVYRRDHFTCMYCGFDGRSFDSWMQLTVDHIRPRSCDGTNEPDNLAVACGACNCITSRMRFEPEMSREQMILA